MNFSVFSKKEPSGSENEDIDTSAAFVAQVISKKKKTVVMNDSASSGNKQKSDIKQNDPEDSVSTEYSWPKHGRFCFYSVPIRNVATNAKLAKVIWVWC